MRYIQRVYNHFRAYHFTIISNILKYNKYGYIYQLTDDFAYKTFTIIYEETQNNKYNILQV